MAEIGVILFIIGGVCLPIGIVVWIIRAIMKKNTAKNMKFTCISMAATIIGFALVVMSPTEESTNEVVSDEEQMKIAVMESVEDSSEYISEETRDVAYEEVNEESSFPAEEVEIMEDSNVQVEEIEYEEETENSALTKNDEFIYPFSEFPYENKKMSKKAMKLYEEAMKAEIEDYICLEELSEGGIINEKVVHYKKTIDEYNAPYRYYGKLNGNNEPDGMGVLLKNWSINPTEVDGGYCVDIYYIGEFKDGYKEGYGIVYDTEEKYELSIKYEGEFRKGKYDGEGTLYSYTVRDEGIQIVREWLFGRELGEPKAEYDYLFEKFEKNNFYSYPITASAKEYSGEFEDGEFHGEGKKYFGVDEDNQPFLTYEGEFENGKYEGKGKEYYYDGGGLKYEGEFKNGNYHGKGTLYDEQGNVTHKGKFKNGDIE